MSSDDLIEEFLRPESRSADDLIEEFLRPESRSAEHQETNDTLEEFLAEIEKAKLPPLPECRVPTTLLTAVDIQTFLPLEEDAVQTITFNLIRRLLNNGPFSFLNLTPFNGNGMYAIYYHGDDPVYTPLRSPGSTCPIYLGKAAQQETSRSLSTRLREHAETIQQTNLGLENFTFRCVCLPANLIDFAEYNLIRLFQPLWNGYLKGFGERPGNRRSTYKRVSRWDTYHPGRPLDGGAPRCLQEIEQDLQEKVPACRKAYEAVMKLMEPTGTSST
jgi:hypothetical protein